MDRSIYSLDRADEALGPRRSPREIRQALAGCLTDPGAPPVAEVRFSGRRVVFSLPPDPAKGARIQDLVASVFGVAEPVFLIRRDRVSLKD